jgi:hypothetical protein
MKEAPGSSETSVLTRATRRNNPEDTILQRSCVLIILKHLKSADSGGSEPDGSAKLTDSPTPMKFIIGSF